MMTTPLEARGLIIKRYRSMVAVVGVDLAVAEGDSRV